PGLRARLGGGVAEVGRRRDGHEGLGGLAVLRGDGRRRLALDDVEVGGGGQRVPERGEVVGGQLAVAGEHDDGRDGVAVGEVGEPVLHGRGLGRGRQVGGAVVGGDL